MGKYGSGLSFATVSRLEREQIEHALDGQIVTGEDENGFVYGPGTQVDCRKVILDAYDQCVYEARQSMASGRAYEKYMEAHGIEINFQELCQYILAENVADLKEDEERAKEK